MNCWMREELQELDHSTHALIWILEKPRSREKTVYHLSEDVTYSGRNLEKINSWEGSKNIMKCFYICRTRQNICLCCYSCKGPVELSYTKKPAYIKIHEYISRKGLCVLFTVGCLHPLGCLVSLICSPRLQKLIFC